MTEIILALLVGTTGILFNKVLDAILEEFQINAPTLKQFISYTIYFLPSIFLVFYGYFFLEFNKSFVLFIAINFFCNTAEYSNFSC